MSGHATALLLKTPRGVTVIRDPSKPAPIYWKFPGGRSEHGETAVECIIREIREELGVRVSADALTVIHHEDKGSHELTIFKAEMTEHPAMNSMGNDGEEIQVFSPDVLLSRTDFFPNHRKVSREILSALV